MLASEDPLTELQALNAQLLAQIEALEEQRERDCRTRDERIEALIEQLRLLKARLYGSSTERRPSEEISPDQGRLLFNEAEAIAHSPQGMGTPEAVSIPAHARRGAGRKALPKQLPRIEVLHDLPEGEKRCAHDGAALELIGREESEQLDYVPAQLRVLHHVRLKYACPCCQGSVKLAPVPAQLLPKSNATPALLAHIATAKYVDGTPLYRQEAQCARLGVHLPRATQGRWMIQIGQEVVPLINLMREVLLSNPVIHMDETRLQVLKSDKAATADHWMWVQAAGPAGQRLVLYEYDTSRAGAVPKRLLEGFQGVLLTDGYEGYSAAVAAHALRHAGCWAHVRRKFEEARKAQVQADSRARLALDYIGQLYAIERHLRERSCALDEQHCLHVRRTRSALVVQQFHQWLIAMSSQVLPHSALGKAIAYALAQWSKLLVFLDHAEVALDNNRCENAIRPFVIGRKNWLFSDTQAGARASANLYSIIETAKANGLEPYAYLTRIFIALPHAARLEDFEALLPWNLKAALSPSR